ncbi:quinolinate synthase NadA [Leucobacter aridicollis]|uniref:Quinolinate synthase n=1 Tax=Leucobacter aridicollis TaxID=283878 RepID=A0A852RCL3_9MICO|nr:quinolinate synthase NadA [Leucobacter aridicollis]MBL3683771.1 quinolinate synthase NadA [Leucobacter aridicollis]NYD26620.1 quinolinate synthase [Leucobacter aridicollis]
MSSVHELIRGAAAREAAGSERPGRPASAPHRKPIALRATGKVSSCDTELASDPWAIDTKPGYGPGASVEDVIPGTAPRQGPLPERYTRASDEQLDEWITAAKTALGDRVRILGHFYQRDEIVKYADFVGDSFMLAQAAKQHPEAESFVFCGVHFMAETADILSGPEQSVILPNLAAGCSMADMATIEQVEACWNELTAALGPAAEGDLQPVIPVTYMNSSAAIKAFCGRNGGIVCTSSNARTVLEWAFERGQRVVFFPDQHLGRNTAKAMGIPEELMPLWRPHLALGGNTAEQLRDSKVILWNGFCSVHKRFTVAQIEQARADYPGVRVIVHPECPAPVVEAADGAGSTEYIRKEVEAAEPGTVLAIGTEINLVNRLQQQRPDLTIFCLDPVVCPCSTMYRIHPAYLAWTLESLLAGQVPNQISVSESVAGDSRIALERMLAAKP